MKPASEYIRRSPFLVLATADADGNQDASPKGDGPGFVAVEDERTLLIPERKGNRLMFSLRNILANPQVEMYLSDSRHGRDVSRQRHGGAEQRSRLARSAERAARWRCWRFALPSNSASSTAPRLSYARSCGSRSRGRSATRSPSVSR